MNFRWIISQTSREKIKKTDNIIDLGCGNGQVLMSLWKEGFTSLTGIDYSSTAINLATKIFQKNQIEGIELHIMNIVDGTILEKFLDNNFHLVHDKGTYDAITMSSDKGAKHCEKYIVNISRILSSDGHLIITSCNWTKKELINHFKSCKV